MQPGIRSRHRRTFVGMIQGNPSIQISILGSSFQYEGNKYMVVEAIEEYALASEEVAYGDSGGKSPMGFMASGG